MSDVTIVEPQLRSHFEVGRPSPLYRRLLDDLPDVFVGGASELCAVVEFLCDQMSTSFQECGMSVPPWRSARALLSKWSLGEEEQRGGSPPTGTPPRHRGAATVVARPPTFGPRMTEAERAAVATAAAAKAACTAAGGWGGVVAGGTAGGMAVARVAWVSARAPARQCATHSPARQ
jgi:hypothetical protein